MAVFADKVLSAVELLAGVLILSIVLGNGFSAFGAVFCAIANVALLYHDTALPGFVLDIVDDPAADEVIDAGFQIMLCAFGKGIAIVGHDDDFGVMAFGVVHDFSGNFMGVVIGDTGYFFIIFCIGATWLVVLRNDTRFGLSIRRQASGADPEGVVPYRLRYKPGSLFPGSAAFGIP